MTEAIYTYGTAENAQFLAEQRDALFNFGTRFPSEEGSSYWLGDDGTPWVGRDRATWITCRMTHVYALAAFTGFEGAEKLVDAGLKGLLGQLHDDDNDGWYPAVSAQGEPAADKQCYAHAFVLLAASSALALGRPGAKELLEKAQNVFLERFWDDGAGVLYASQQIADLVSRGVDGVHLYTMNHPCTTRRIWANVSALFKEV